MVHSVYDAMEAVSLPVVFITDLMTIAEERRL